MKLLLKHKQIANFYFFVGFAVIIFEALINRKVVSYISENGILLWPSEFWFIVVGNTLLFVLFCANPFRLKIMNLIPILVVIFVLYFGFFHGLIVSNKFVMEEFRELCFHSLIIPPILFLSPHLNFSKSIKFVMFILVPVTFIWTIIAFRERFYSGFEYTNRVYPFCASICLSYCIIIFSHGKKTYLLVALIFVIASVSQFSKTILTSLVFCLLFSLYFSSKINNDVRSFFLSKFNFKLLSYLFTSIILLASMLYVVDIYLGGLISLVIKTDFLKIRLSESGIITKGNLTGGRLEMWNASLKYWLESPFFGHGMGAVLNVYSSGWNEKSQLHNYLLQSLQNFGLFGFIIIITCSLKWISDSISKLRNTLSFEDRIVNSCLLVFVLMTLVVGMYSHPLSTPTISILFWFSLSYLSVQDMNNKILIKF